MKAYRKSRRRPLGVVTFQNRKIYLKPISVAARFKAWICAHSFTEIEGSNPTEAWMSVSSESCVL
jgi:hypothetical protein